MTTIAIATYGIYGSYQGDVTFIYEPIKVSLAGIDTAGVLRCHKNDRKEVKATLTDRDGSPFDLTNYTVTLIVKDNSKLANNNSVIGPITGAKTGNVVDFVLTKENTDVPGGNYFYDIVATNSVANIKKTIIKNQFVLINYNNLPEQNEIELFKGDTKRLLYTVTDKDGAIFNLTGYSITFNIVEASNLQTIKTISGVSSAPTTGVVSVNITESVSKLPSGTYYYHLYILNGDYRYTIAKDKLIIKETVNK